MAGRGAQRAYGPLLQRMLEEQEQLERVSMTRITASFVGGLDLPPLAQGRSRISNASPALPDASHLQRVKTLGALDGVAPRRALRGSASTSRLDASSAYAAMSLAAAGRQRKSVAATHRENVVLKARIADLEALAHHHAAELARLRDAQSTLHETAAERVSKIAVLREISKVLSDTDVDSATMIARLVEMTATALNCERVSLFLLSEDGTELYLKTANDCAPDIRVPVGAGIVGNVAQTKELVNIRDAQSDPRFFKGSDRKTGFKTISILCSVIQTPVGSVVGVMQAINRKPNVEQPAPIAPPRGGPHAPRAVAFSAEDEELLSHIVSQASIALHSAMLYEQAVAARLRSQALLDLVSVVAVERNFSALTTSVSEIVTRALGASEALLLIFNHERNELWALPQHGRPGWSISFPHEPTDCPTLAETIARKHKALADAAAGAPREDATRGTMRAQPVEPQPVGLSWLAWQVMRTAQRLNSSDEDELRVELDVLLGTERRADAKVAAAAGGELGAARSAAGAGRLASALLVCPSVDLNARVVAVVVAAGKARSVMGGGNAASRLAGLDTRSKAAYFDAHDEEAMLAICSKLAIAFEVRSMEMMRSKVAIDMAADDSTAGRLQAFDLGDLQSPEPSSSSRTRRRTRILEQRNTLITAIQASAFKMDISRLQGWDLDMLAMADEELHTVALTCMNTFGLPDKLGFAPAAFLTLCSHVRERYRPNPYHNYAHAISVMQAAFLVLTTTDAGARLKPTSLFSILLASLFHDIDHPATNNAFQVNSGSHLALLYNDQSVLENHHAATAFQLLRDHSEIDPLRGLSAADRTAVRSEMLHCILATDMSKHFELVNRLKTLSTSAEAHSAADQTLLMESIVHAADLANPLLEPAVSLKWADAVLAEFNQQARLEQEQGLPFDPKMLKSDRVSQANLNRGFIDYIVAPLWQALAQHFPQLEGGIKQMMANRAAWDKIIADDKAETDGGAANAPTVRAVSSALSRSLPSRAQTNTGAEDGVSDHEGDTLHEAADEAAGQD